LKDKINNQKLFNKRTNETIKKSNEKGPNQNKYYYHWKEWELKWKTKHKGNCNWMTKLKKKQNFYKRNKNEIRNSKNEDWNRKTINKEDNCVH
jgi:hypothetical protein